MGFTQPCCVARRASAISPWSTDRHPAEADACQWSSLASSCMRVGVSIDGFNLYYGAKGLCGKGQQGWRWLDVRALSQTLITNFSGWTEPEVARVVYCTARRGGEGNHAGAQEQEIYLRALQAGGTIDVLELGQYVNRVSTSPLAIKGRKGKPQLVTPDWPVMVKDGDDEISSANFFVSVARREEKGSDVSVAAHLLIDLFEDKVDAAVIVSNDSDLAFPIMEARKRIPLGVVNPTKGYPAGKLACEPTFGVGDHWWHQLTAAEVMGSQLPDPVGRVRKPPPW